MEGRKEVFLYRDKHAGNLRSKHGKIRKLWVVERDYFNISQKEKGNNIITLFPLEFIYYFSTKSMIESLSISSTSSIIDSTGAFGIFKRRNNISTAKQAF